MYAVFFSSLLGVKVVSVSGAPDALAANVRAEAGVAQDAPLARIDLDAVAERIERLPDIAQVEVSRGWPDTVAISVTPRVPIGVTSANGQLWLLDATGEPYRAVDSVPPDVLPVELATPGSADPATDAALAVIQVLTPEIRADVVQVSARTAYDVELQLTDGRSVIWGEATDADRKVHILPAVLEQPGTRYDISDPTLVSVR